MWDPKEKLEGVENRRGSRERWWDIEETWAEQVFIHEFLVRLIQLHLQRCQQNPAYFLKVFCVSAPFCWPLSLTHSSPVLWVRTGLSDSSPMCALTVYQSLAALSYPVSARKLYDRYPPAHTMKRTLEPRAGQTLQIQSASPQSWDCLKHPTVFRWPQP